MRKHIAFIVIVMSIFACGQFQSPQALSTQTAAAAASSTPVPTNTPAINYSGDLGIFSAQIYDGPGTDYPVTFVFYGKVTIVGQAFQCAWYKVVSNSDPTEAGWISADKLTSTLTCPDVQKAYFAHVPIPTSTDTPVPPTDTPLPTDTPVPPTPVATSAPAVRSAPSVSCMINSNIIIQNRSGAPFTIYLTGPGNFTFNLGSGDYSTVKVCSGSYNYTVYGTCHGSPASGSGRISDGDQVYFSCN
jgi:hypothetical protein